MKSIKTVAIIIVFSCLLSAAMYISKNNLMASVDTVSSSEGDPSEHDRQLCERLIRFGQVAFDRRQYAEAKHFFQKAITVDPSHILAWKKYNLALIALISAKMMTDPGFVPEFSSDTGVIETPGAGIIETPGQTSTDMAEDDDDC